MNSRAMALGSVGAELWPVISRLGAFQNGCQAGNGSSRQTSITAAASWPACRAATRSWSTTATPRPALMNRAVGRMQAKIAAS
ncbi:hypothetical protein D3C84_1131930 [compost metagenome]